MIPILSREQIRNFDRHATDQCAVPSVLLMENAGRGAAEVVERAAGERGPVVVLAGPGNNGGDGFVVARRLHTRGVAVQVFLASSADKVKGDARTNYDAYLGIGGTVRGLADDAGAAAFIEALSSASVVVDALLGTGLDRDVTGRFAELIEQVNEAACTRVALDIPSGLHAETGAPLGVAVRAHETVTFAHLKMGLVTSVGAEHAGQVTTVDIGVPPGLVDAVGQSAQMLEARDVADWLLPRPVSAHKGAAGRVMAVCGSPGKTGAALLVARGALRAGAGLVTIVTTPEARDAIDRRVLEEMTAAIDIDRIEESLDHHLEAADAVAIGPGLGLDERARRIVDRVVLEHAGPVVVDADAITHFADRAGDLTRAKGPRILTPHPGELGRLIGKGAREVERDRFGALTEAVKVTGSSVLLKGARTLIGDENRVVVNPTGTPALATGGAGDVLSGVVAALSAALDSSLAAAAAAAFVHGRAAERWTETSGGADRGLLAHEIADTLPAVLAGLTRPGRRLTD